MEEKFTNKLAEALAESEMSVTLHESKPRELRWVTGRRITDGIYPSDLHIVDMNAQGDQYDPDAPRSETKITTLCGETLTNIHFVSGLATGYLPCLKCLEKLGNGPHVRDSRKTMTEETKEPEFRVTSLSATYLENSKVDVTLTLAYMRTNPNIDLRGPLTLAGVHLDRKILLKLQTVDFDRGIFTFSQLVELLNDRPK